MKCIVHETVEVSKAAICILLHAFLEYFLIPEYWS